MVNHTVQLINNNAVDGIREVIARNIWVDCIITKFDMGYFYEDTLEDTLAEVAQSMSAVLASDGTVYIQTAFKYIPLVSNIFEHNHLKLQNILLIPSQYLEHCKGTCGRMNCYDDNDVNYVLFFSQKCTSPRLLNPLNTDDKACGCKIPSYWNWFSGSEIAAYRNMMKISTDHGNTVLDPFMNYGDTGVAAIRQDRNYIGIEVSRARYEDAKRRLQELGE